MNKLKVAALEVEHKTYGRAILTWTWTSKE